MDNRERLINHKFDYCSEWNIPGIETSEKVAYQVQKLYRQTQHFL